MARFASCDVQDSTQQGLKQEPQPKHSFFCLESLYCSEESWEELEEESCSHNNGDDENTFPALLLDQDLDEELSALLSKEEQKSLGPDPCLDPTRIESVDWILKVVSHYSFSPLTAILAVNYFDRFFSSFRSQTENPWMSQLAAVACLSLAAKVEEVYAPLLLDLQVEDSKYMFEAKAIQRMEILVLSALQWRMHPVTPLSFLDYFTRRLGLEDFLCFEFTKRCELTLLSVIPDFRFVLYLPAVMATATMLHVIKNVAPSVAESYQNHLIGFLKIDKGKVEECLKLIKEVTETCHGSRSNKRKFGSIAVPGSPNSVMDMSFSSDSANGSCASTSSSASSSPEQVSKKSKAYHQEQLILQRS